MPQHEAAALLVVMRCHACRRREWDSSTACTLDCWGGLPLQDVLPPKLGQAESAG